MQNLVMQNFYLSAAIIAGIAVGVLAGVVLIGAAVTAIVQLSFRYNRLKSAIREKLHDLNAGKEAPVILTKSDELNKILLEIDELASALNNNIKKNAIQKENLATILENTQFAIIALNKDKTVRVSNSTAKKLFKFNYDYRPIGEVVRDLEFNSKLKECLTSRVDTVFDMTTHNGDILEVKIIPTNAEKIDCIITAQVVTKTRNLLKEKQDFFVNASHELNTPLTSVMGYCELLKKEKKYNAKFIEEIFSQSQRMHSLISDMLSLSKLEGTEQSIASQENVEIYALVGGVVNGLMPKASDKKIKLKLESSGKEQFLNAEKEKLTALVSNLVDNAIKYTKSSGEVVVSLNSDDNGALKLTVADTGIGIPQEHLSRIFERFYRVDPSRHDSSGTGLGLAIVKHICNLYSYKLDIKSTVSKGTEIEIIF